MRIAIPGVCMLLCLIMAACSFGRPDRPPSQHREEEWHALVQMLLKYVEPDGRLTRAQMEAGLHRDFDLADKNHSGVLEPDEVRAINEQRWNEDRSASTPLQDWKGNGLIDFDEFAAAARALFSDLDRDHSGVLTPEELRAARGLGPETGAKDSPSTDGQNSPRRGRRGPPGG